MASRAMCAQDGRAGPPRGAGRCHQTSRVPTTRAARARPSNHHATGRFRPRRSFRRRSDRGALRRRVRFGAASGAAAVRSARAALRRSALAAAVRSARPGYAPPQGPPAYPPTHTPYGYGPPPAIRLSAASVGLRRLGSAGPATQAPSGGRPHARAGRSGGGRVLRPRHRRGRDAGGVERRYVGHRRSTPPSTTARPEPRILGPGPSTPTTLTASSATTRSTPKAVWPTEAARPRTSATPASRSRRPFTPP